MRLSRLANTPSTVAGSPYGVPLPWLWIASLMSYSFTNSSRLSHSAMFFGSTTMSFAPTSFANSNSFRFSSLFIEVPLTPKV